MFLISHLFAQEKAYIIPSANANVKQTSLLLNGIWQFQFSPDSKWTQIQVPGEAAMQGYAIPHDKPFKYKKSFSVPSDYRGQTVILRFDGVYSYARLFVNGTFVREHHGGFTRWETNVTTLIKPGKKNEIELEVTDRLDEISYGSGYAHHPIGGILRDVTLFALPKIHVHDFHVETQLYSLYRDAVLKIAYSTEDHEDATITFELTDTKGKTVQLPQTTFLLTANGQEQSHEISIKNPLKWDAEHPHLYTLTSIIRQNGKEISRFSRFIGFRDIKIIKNQMFVNGKPVKLRGACRHDIHPVLGRTTTAEYDSLDAVLYKQAHMNFVRTSHYPPSEKFVEYCDRFGIYVECETAVCFVQTARQKNYRPDASQSDPNFSDRYLSQLREMVKTFRSHPAVLFWSLGNENVYGSNFRLCHDWLKTTDHTRPVSYSYPGTQKDESKIYDILSMHYPNIQGDLSQNGASVAGFQKPDIPVVFDEWAHVPCYVHSDVTLRNDPNIREFWGASLDMMWTNIFNVPGGLGGSIWGFVDETFMLPTPKAGETWWKEFAKTPNILQDGFQGNCIGYGEWGLVDTWRRHKPEFWATKKAYSPVRLLTTRITDFTEGERLLLPVHNRFDHTNLNELIVRYAYQGVEKEMKLTSIEPHQKGILIIPEEKWKDGEKLFIRFHNAANELVDAELVSLGVEKNPLPVRQTANAGLTVEETDEFVIVKGAGFEIPFDKKTGLIRRATSHGEVIIEQGPFLNTNIHIAADVKSLAGNWGKTEQFILSENDWKKTDFTYKKENRQVKISLSGMYNDVSVDFNICISSQGAIQTDYIVTGTPDGYVRETGIKFLLPETIDNLEWKRKGYWTYYPENALAGNEGSTSLYGSKQAAYGQQPVQSWTFDTRNYFYWADAGANCKKPLTQMAKGMKEHIYQYTISTKTKQASLSVLSADASVACRINKNEQEHLILYANNRWDYPELGWGNYCKALEANPCYGGVKIDLK
ncbi:MAG: Beta-galactosidase [Candidatus Ordinivivax streblomastigis]|uniref:beta-galactosidase n=1 Tax=Candidatus Ordinivivax streblomastigis TaxID=2540710 RepID=A0A5M8NW84_9BACT|nr:MAG: Beta-galactosidase [Candidatus Ordinivivax streblomastigis]